MQQLMQCPQRAAAGAVPTSEVSQWAGWKQTGRGRVKKIQRRDRRAAQEYSGRQPIFSKALHPQSHRSNGACYS